MVLIIFIIQFVTLTHDDWIPGIKHVLGQYFQFAGENSDMFELFPLALFEFFSICHEFVEKMVYDVGLENFDAERISEFLSISFDFHIES